MYKESEEMKIIAKESSATLNPLHIPKLLELILSYIYSVEDLKKVRTVSKLWIEITLEKWRAKAVLLLSDESKMELIFAFGCPAVAIENTIFFNLMEKPFQNYRYSPKFSSQKVPPPFRLCATRSNSTHVLWCEFLSKAKYLDLGDCKQLLLQKRLFDEGFFFKFYCWKV